jgi:uncharacterized protein DUF4038/collagenase-like protein with putative collagen-binding domain
MTRPRRALRPISAVRLSIALALGLFLDAPGAFALDSGSGASATTEASSPEHPPPAHPLKADPTGRYLIDQNNVPFMMIGDSPQSLIGDVSLADAAIYFANRKANGFNTVWINLLCRAYTHCSANGTTFDGIAPFTTAGNLSTPNEAYFQRVDAMINLAAQYDLLVLLDPIETGGWLPTLRSNGLTKARAYGQYLGTRYRSFDNIIWMSGNDFQSWRTSSDDALVLAVANGIRDTDNRHIHTVELDFPTSGSLDDANWRPIVHLNAAYTYNATYSEVLKQYNQPNPVPVFMVEANYEFEQNIADRGDPDVLRLQEYWTMLSGATGQLYGSFYTDVVPSDWLDNLDTPGVQQFGIMTRLFSQYRWYGLVPDQTHAIVTSGYGTYTTNYPFQDNDYVTAAALADGSLVLAYLPQRNTITVDMSKLASSVTAKWFDPTNGATRVIAGSPFANSGSRQFSPPGNNSDGFRDWLLILEATPSSGVTVISDTFAGANGTLLTAHMPDVDTPGVAWTMSGATPVPTIRNGVAGIAGGSGHVQATLNSGIADIVMGVDYRVGGVPHLGALVFRLTDANNHLLLSEYADTINFFRRQNGVYTLLASQPIGAVAAGSTHRLEVRASGTTLQGWWDNTLLLQVTEAFQQTAMRHGLDWNSAYDATATFDNFEIRTQAASVSPPETPSLPNPANGSGAVPTNKTLSWTAPGATSFDVQFGTTNPPALAATGLITAGYTPSLSAATTYFWRVVAHGAGGSTSGPVWSFTTGTGIPADLVISDVFAGTNGALLTAHAPDVDKPGVAWTITGATPAPVLVNGTVGIAAGSGHLQATLNTGISDIIMGADYRVGGQPQLGALVFRLTDANNHLLLVAYGDALNFFRRQNGVYTLLASQPVAAIAAGSTHRLEVRTAGSTLQGWWDNVLLLQVTESFQQTATRHGLDWNSAYDPTAAFDNFEIRTPGAGVSPPDAPSLPAPADASSNVPTNTTLGWTASGATSFDLRLGPTNPPPLAATGLTNASNAPALTPSTTYFWQVVAHGAGGAATGPVWSFTTGTGPSIPADLIIADTFAGANGTLLTAHTPDVDKPGVAWTITGAMPAPTLVGGAVGIAAGSGHLQATLNGGVADIVMGVDYRVGNRPQLGALVFRLTDANNHLLLSEYGDTVNFFRRQNGVYMLLASQPIAPVAIGSTHRLELRANGSTLQGWWDNTLLLQVTEPFQQTATRHGLDWNSAYDASATFDNFEMRSAVGAVPPPAVPASPSPVNAASNVGTNASLSWIAPGATTFDLRLGPTNPPSMAAAGLTSASGTPALSPTTTYFWQVIAHGPGGSTSGPVWSFTTGTGPSIAADLIIADTFTGTNGTLLTTHTPDVDRPGVAWTMSGATPVPTISNGMVGIVAGSGHLQATLNSGAADIIMGVDYRVGNRPQLGALVFRFTDTNNHLLLEEYADGLYLFKRQNGVYTLLASQPITPVAVGSTHRLELRASGSTLQGWWDNTLRLQLTESFQQAATRHGLDWNSAYDATATFDNFEIRTVQQ